MTIKDQRNNSVSFTSSLTVTDPLGHYWINYVTTLLRREICWNRVVRSGNVPNDNKFLPEYIHQIQQQGI
jgi:hypothetical protein